MQGVVAVILGGGKGTRLLPLTEFRSKPSVPFGGKYRLIDVPISNCINSGISRCYVLTQFNSASLHRHIRQTYHFDTFRGGFVEILAAQQTYKSGTDWYQGTADAVRKQLRYLKRDDVKHVLILSGDQLYRMDYRRMFETHCDSEADVTISAVPVDEAKAKSFGIMRTDESGRVLGFVEKPKSPSLIDEFRTSPEWMKARGIESQGREFVASMGIYLFNRTTLVEMLEGSQYSDFGKEVFPMSIRARQVQMHLFDGYWEDIGTIEAFYKANLELANPAAAFPLLHSSAQIYTRPRYLPPTRMDGATVTGSLIADGCTIEPGATITNSVIGLRCRIGRDVVIRDSFVMGADGYEREADNGHAVRLGIGQGTHITRAIVDKNCRIGRGHRIGPDSPPVGEPGDVSVQEGICVVRRGAILDHRE